MSDHLFQMTDLQLLRCVGEVSGKVQFANRPLHEMMAPKILGGERPHANRPLRAGLYAGQS